MGVQGGYHVWISLRARGLAPGSRAMLTIETTSLAGRRPPEASQVSAYFESDEEEAGWARLLGWPAVLSQPACDLDHEVEVRVRVVDSEGQPGDATGTLVPRGSFSLQPCAADAANPAR